MVLKKKRRRRSFKEVLGEHCNGRKHAQELRGS